MSDYKLNQLLEITTAIQTDLAELKTALNNKPQKKRVTKTAKNEPPTLPANFTQRIDYFLKNRPYELANLFSTDEVLFSMSAKATGQKARRAVGDYLKSLGYYQLQTTRNRKTQYFWKKAEGDDNKLKVEKGIKKKITPSTPAALAEFERQQTRDAQLEAGNAPAYRTPRAILRDWIEENPDKALEGVSANYLHDLMPPGEVTPRDLPAMLQELDFISVFFQPPAWSDKKPGQVWVHRPKNQKQQYITSTAAMPPEYYDSRDANDLDDLY